jgi:hypothetical protein
LGTDGPYILSPAYVLRHASVFHLSNKWEIDTWGAAVLGHGKIQHRWMCTELAAGCFDNFWSDGAVCTDWIDLFIYVALAAGIGFFFGELTGYSRGYMEERHRWEIERDHRESLKQQQSPKEQQP